MAFPPVLGFRPRRPDEAQHVPGPLGSGALRFGLRGPSQVVSTGCASSTDALGHAFRAVKFGTEDIVLTGGVDATVVRGVTLLTTL